MADDPLLPLLAKRPEIVNYGVGNMPVPGCDTWHIGPCWALHLYDYEATIFINEAPITIAPGMVTLAPPGSTMRWEGPVRPSHHVYAVFRWPRGPAVMSISLGRRTAQWRSALIEAAGWMYASRQRLEIRLWDHLWEFRELLQAQSRKDSQAPMAERARQSIDERLAQPLRLGALADELGVSQAHLCRAFKSAFGQSPGTYRRTRRAEQARMLLAQTTMSLAQVAGHTGLGSMQNCNKALRRTFGLSSRRLRYGS